MIPPDGAVVMVVIQFIPQGENHPADTGFITPDECVFMPDLSAMVVVTGVDDARVAETLKRIQKARDHERLEPRSTGPATRTTTRPTSR